MKGTYAVMVTPMTSDQEVDLDGLKKNIDWYVEEGVPGICVCGGTGEFASLTKEERLAIAETAVKHANGRIKCIVGTAAETTRETVYLSKHAEEIGANGCMVINPYYCVPNADELYVHYKAVSEAVNIPIMIYNNPAHSGVDMKPEFIIKLSGLNNIGYIKDASGDLRRIADFRRLSNGKINIFCGCEDLAFENFILGATGWISVCANIIPRKSQLLFELVEQNKISEARELFNKLFPLLDMLEKRPKPLQKLKYTLELMGRAGGPCRLPRLPLTEQEKNELIAILKDSEVI